MIHTSYFAKYRGEHGVRISRGGGKIFDGPSYPALMPSKALLQGYKDGTVTEKEYRKQYIKQLKGLDVHAVYGELDGCVLLCYEAPDKFCHRHIVSEWFNRAGYECAEYGLEPEYADFKYVTIDIETTGLNRYKDTITWVGIGLAEDMNADLGWIGTFDMSSKKQVEQCLRVLAGIRKAKLKTVFQNGKFDTLFMEYHYGVKPIPIHLDTQLLGTAYDLAAEHGLKDMAKRYLGVEDWDISKKDKKSGVKDIVEPYLRFDLKYTWGLCRFFHKRMTEHQWKIYDELLRPAYLMYRDAERCGIYLDLGLLRDVKKDYAQKEKERFAALKAKYDINWNSSAQVAKVLFEDEELPVIKKSKKTGNPSADTATLKRLAAQGNELPKMIIDYKEINTRNKMFLSRWESDLGPDGRIHPSFNLTNVVSGRTSCQNPNLQQVPRTKEIRSIFRAPKKKVFFEADYSQLELRIAADYANDPTMIEIYRTGGDIHTTTAKLMTAGREPTKEERNKAKAVNFGFLYGMMANKFVDYAYDSYGVVFSRAEAEQFRRLFFAKYGRLLPWHEEMERLCEAQGGVANRFGRFRKLPLIYSSNKWERASAARRAINTPVQGTGSDLLIGSAMEINRKYKKDGVLICGTIHDAIVGECWEEDVEWVVPEIKRIMAHPEVMDIFDISFKIPLDVDVGVGPWGTH